MIMFKQLIINWKQKCLSRRIIDLQRDIAFVNLKTAKSCLFFGIDEDIVVEDLLCLKSFLPKHIETDILILTSCLRERGVWIEGAVYVNEDSISSFGRFVDSSLSVIEKKSYDLLIDFSIKKNSFGDYILRSSLAKCIIGRSREGGCHDISLERVESSGDFVMRVKELLSTVNAY